MACAQTSNPLCLVLDDSRPSTVIPAPVLNQLIWRSSQMAGSPLASTMFQLQSRRKSIEMSYALMHPPFRQLDIVLHQTIYQLDFAPLVNTPQRAIRITECEFGPPFTLGSRETYKINIASSWTITFISKNRKSSPLPVLIYFTLTAKVTNN